MKNFFPKLKKKKKKTDRLYILAFNITAIIALATYLAHKTRYWAASKIMPAAEFTIQTYQWLSLNVFSHPGFKLFLAALTILAISVISPFLRARIYSKKNASRTKKLFKFSGKLAGKSYKLKIKILYSLLKGKLAVLTGAAKMIKSFIAPVRESEIRKLIEIIESINIQEVRSEEDFEKQLFQRLDAKEYKVQRQVHYGSNNIVDLIVDGHIGVELKVADKAKNVRDLVGQITAYRKHLKKIIVGILDSGDVPDSEMKEYAKMIKKVDRKNVHVIIIKGEVRRLKKRML